MKEDLKVNNLHKAQKYLAVMDNFHDRFLVLYLFISLNSCDQRKDLVDQPLYEGPVSSLDSVNTLVSDSGLFVMHVEAPKQQEFETGDIEWPEGVFVEYFDKQGNVTTLFSADYVYYTKKEELYHAKGDVVVRNNQTADELTTEELFWDEVKEEYYTEKFVTIKSDDEVHTGEGLKANRDFTSYQILKPSGTFTLEDDPSSSLKGDSPPPNPEIAPDSVSKKPVPKGTY
ncbi:MAG: LPS export ABC transporter periplasmic protein LptC [Ekhidna sp.]|nr:LPS export ABC transporter periplasmic protein LptC [Ekhidna sp.]